MNERSGHRSAGALDTDELLLDPAAGGVDRGSHLGQLRQRGIAAVIAQPQALAQHLAHGLSDRVLAAIAGNGLDFGPGGAQSRLQGVGGVQYLADGALMRVRPAPPQGQGGGNGRDGEKQDKQGVRHGVSVQGRKAPV
jgi:hypothetical protein